MTTDGERISKRISHAGICSRRDAERLIAQGKVKLNGKRIDTPVINVTDGDIIEIDGITIGGYPETALWLYHKPRGLITTHKDPEGRPTVFDALPKTLPRLISIGRLDLDSEGLLLLTNNGELSRHLEHPSTGWQRRYRVRIHGFPSTEQVQALKAGITIDDTHYRPILITREKEQSDGANIWALVTLEEGKNREIRRVMEHLGYPVSRLIRVSYGSFQLGNLPAGEIKQVSQKVLKNTLGKGFEI